MSESENKNESENKYRILVTGASGHIGESLVERLQQLGHDVYRFERYVSTRYQIPLSEKIVYGEITDYYAVHQAVKQVQPHVVCHLAALGTQDLYAYQHPHENLLVHALGTINVAEAIRDIMLKSGEFKLFLHASSSEVYGNHKWPDEYPSTETTSLNPNSPYAVGKIAAENYLNYLYSAYGFPMVILRPFNTYGFNRPARTLIDRVTREMLEGKGQINLGDPKPIRDWLWIDDHVDAYLHCLDNMDVAVGETFNFCTGMAISVEETVDQIRALTYYRGSIVWNTGSKRPNDILAILGTYKKAEEKLGWTPQVTHIQGIRKLVERWRK